MHFFLLLIHIFSYSAYTNDTGKITETFKHNPSTQSFPLPSRAHSLLGFLGYTSCIPSTCTADELMVGIKQNMSTFLFILNKSIYKTKLKIEKKNI